MSTEIEQRVVEMQFDNKQFERNVSTTMSSLDKLKQSLNLSGAAKGLESVGTAARGINLSGLTSAAETVGLKFNAMWTVADQALRNITNSAVNAGKRIASALTIDPIKTGFTEYETQINAVQTILANTKSKGTTIDDVNTALDELNSYADKTIYNFTEMTRNIGTFTAAGVDLDKSVTSIKGIANLAAVSGSTSQQASTAMYQLSQALAAGRVSLMDWNSVVNAGMGGEVFQNALKRTAEVMNGVDMDAMIEEYGSFRESLTQGEWLTADVLTETLSQLSGAYTEADLLAKGYTKQQAKDILELADTAESAATDVKTFTQLWDTLKESAQSGWTQTWEILVGDFEEAKALLSGISKVIGKMIGDSADARNELLQGWKDAGGRADLIEGFKSAFEGIMNIVKPIKEAFRNIFPPATVDQLVGFTDGFKNLMRRFEEFTASHGDQIRITFEGIFAVIDIGWTFVKELAGGIKDLVGNFLGLGGSILDTSASIGEWLINLRDTVKETDIFGKAVDGIRKAFAKIGEFLKPIVTGIKEFGSAISETFVSISSNASERLGPLAVIGNVIKAVFSSLGGVIKKVAPYLFSAASAIGAVFSNLADQISASVKEADYSKIFDVLNGGIFATIGAFIAKFVKSSGDLIDNAGGFVEGIKDTLDSVRGCFEAYQKSIQADTIKKIAVAIAILAAAIFVISSIDADQLGRSLGAITILFTELIAALSIFSKMDFDNKGLIKGVAAINGLAAALVVLAVAMKIMSTMSWSEIGVGITGTVAGLGALVAAVNLLPEENVTKSAKAIGKLATAVVILAAGMKIMASMSWQELGVAIVGVVGGLGALVAAVNLLPQDAALRSLGMVGLATAMVILGGALKLMGSMSWEEIARGLVAMAGSMLILAGAMNLMITALPGAAAMLIVAPALVILAGAMKLMGSMSWDEVAHGLAALGGALAEIAIAMNLMMLALPGAAAMLVVAGALAILTPVLMALGSMSMAEIGKSLLMLAGAFTVIGLAAYVLTPVIPAILGLAGALALLGLACTTIGAGVLMLGVGLTAISAAGSAAALSLVTIVSSIIGLIPYLIEQVGVGIVALCGVISGSASAICSAITTILVSVVDAVVTSAPALIEGVLVLLTSLLEMLIEYTPQLIPLVVSLVTELLSALSGQASALVESIFGFLGAILGAISENLTLLIEPIASLFGAIFQGIADILGPIIQSVIAPILGVLADMVVGLVEAIAPYIPQLTAMFVTLSTVISDAIVKIVEAIAPFIPSIKSMVTTICNAFVALASQIAPIIDSISNLVKILGDIIIGVLDSISVTISTIGEAIKSALSGLAETFDSVFNGIATVITSVGDSIRSVLDGLAGVIESIGTAALNAGTGFENLASGVKTITELKLADMVASLAAVATGIGGIASHSSNLKAVADAMTQLRDGTSGTSSGFKAITSSITALGAALTRTKEKLSGIVQAFTNASVNMKKVGSDLLGNVVAGFESQKTKLSASAKSAITQFITAMRKGQAGAKAACMTLVASCVSAIKSAVGSFNSAAAYLVKGFAAGISRNTYMAAARARAMAAAAAEAARKELDEHSPSKVGYEIGDFFGVAFVKAIADNTKRAYNASADLANSAKTGLKGAFDKVTRLISGEVDVNPTIRPVLDLTNVKSGANAINSMLGLTPSVGVLAHVGAVSSMMNQRSQAASNDDVIYAINKLQKALANTGNTTNIINGVTYDDGSNIHNTVAELIRAIKMGGRA